MKRPRLKRFLPRSLIGRTALILLLPILTIQVVVSYVFIQRLYENVTEQMTRSMLAPLRLVAAEIAAADSREAARIMLADDETPPDEKDEVAVFDLANAVTNWELSDPTPDY